MWTHRASWEDTKKKYLVLVLWDGLHFIQIKGVHRTNWTQATRIKCKSLFQCVRFSLTESVVIWCSHNDILSFYLTLGFFVCSYDGPHQFCLIYFHWWCNGTLSSFSLSLFSSFSPCLFLSSLTLPPCLDHSFPSNHCLGCFLQGEDSFTEKVTSSSLHCHIRMASVPVSVCLWVLKCSLDWTDQGSGL